MTEELFHALKNGDVHCHSAEELPYLDIFTYWDMSWWCQSDDKVGRSSLMVGKNNNGPSCFFNRLDPPWAHHLMYHYPCFLPLPFPSAFPIYYLIALELLPILYGVTFWWDKCWGSWGVSVWYTRMKDWVVPVLVYMLCWCAVHSVTLLHHSKDIHLMWVRLFTEALSERFLSSEY